jgi:hypothetical protein
MLLNEVKRGSCNSTGVQITSPTLTFKEVVDMIEQFVLLAKV